MIVEPDVIGFGAEEPRPQHQAWWSGLLETDKRSHACASATMPVRTRTQGSRHAMQQTPYSPQARMGCLQPSC